jgi:hypothetical protein
MWQSVPPGCLSVIIRKPCYVGTEWRLNLRSGVIYLFTHIQGVPGGRDITSGVFLMLKYTDITQNTYIQSWTVTEIMAREKCGLLWYSTHCTCQLKCYRRRVLEWGFVFPRLSWHWPWTACVLPSGWRQRWYSCAMYSAWNPTDNYDIIASVFVVQFNGFISLIC